MKPEILVLARTVPVVAGRLRLLVCASAGRRSFGHRYLTEVRSTSTLYRKSPSDVAEQVRDGSETLTISEEEATATSTRSTLIDPSTT